MYSPASLPRPRAFAIAGAMLLLGGLVPAPGQTPTPAGTPAPSGALFDFNAANAASRCEGEDGGQIAGIVADKGGHALKVLAKPEAGEHYPGVSFALPEGGWNLKKFTGVQAKVTNQGATEITVNLRIDNTGEWQDRPWNAENVAVAPGETKIVSVQFGTSFHAPGYALDPSRITAVHVFLHNMSAPATFLVQSLTATR